MQTNQTAVTAGQKPVASDQRSVASNQWGGQIVAGGVPVEEFIKKAEVARRLKKTVRCIDNWMSRGILPYYKIGRSVAFKWSEIEAALARTCRVCRS